MEPSLCSSSFSSPHKTCLSDDKIGDGPNESQSDLQSCRVENVLADFPPNTLVNIVEQVAKDPGTQDMISLLKKGAVIAHDSLTC